MNKTVGPSAALAGIPAGLQALGPWQGRRQLFVRFAAEAETATMYTADAMGGELKRWTARGAFHSIAVGGRDPLGNAEFLVAAFDRHAPPLPVLLEVDGQRPDALPPLMKHLGLLQVVLDGGAADANLERACESLAQAKSSKVPHALVVLPGDATSDGQLLRIVEQAHAASDEVQVVVHPPANTPVDRDRRWIMLMERATALHGDTRFMLRLPPPTGMR
ncbi:MAG: Radical domain protein [Gemmatimonadetes bacterium]|nr:Radical domain protein [Gemmatimonadota bacterium]